MGPKLSEPRERGDRRGRYRTGESVELQLERLQGCAFVQALGDRARELVQV